MCPRRPRKPSISGTPARADATARRGPPAGPDLRRSAMSAREEMLAAVRDRLPVVPPLPQVPDFATDTGDLVSVFTAALHRLDGKVVTAPPAGLQSWLATAFPDARRICSATDGVTGNVDQSSFSDWAA